MYIEGKFYSFTTMNRSKIQIFQKGTDVEICAENNNYRLELCIQTEEKDFTLLKGPKDGNMIPVVQENLKGLVKIAFMDKKNGIRLEDQGRMAGVEYGGKSINLLRHSAQI